MTQEDKLLLLQDLCTRLPYGVICNTSKGDGHLCSINQTIFGTEYGINIKATERDYFNDREEVIKPYLRTMFSMTEGEKKQTRDLWIGADTKTHAIRLIDFYNKNHFDYRGLIPKGLAIDVTKESNPYKE